MKDVFVMLEGDVVQWAHAQAAAKGTSVSRLLSTMLRERMGQAVQPHASLAMPLDSGALASGWPLVESAAASHWPRRVLDDD